MFLTIYVAIIIATAIKKDCTHSNNCGIQFHDGDLEHILMKQKKRSSYVFLPTFMLFFPTVIPDLDLGILKMLIRVSFRDVIQPAGTN